MVSFKTFWENPEEDYRGQHQAPTAGEGSAPLWDLTQIYPDDIYSSKAAQYYGDASPLDNYAIAVMHSARNKPNIKIAIYRAVPNIESTDQKISRLYKEKAYILKRGSGNPSINNQMAKLGINNISKYFDYIYNEIKNLESNPPVATNKLSINKGDWVTTVRQYAVDHGEAALRGEYKILKKLVPAKHLFTDANSIFEFGYDPSA
jgi:hypothetical protein